MSKSKKQQEKKNQWAAPCPQLNSTLTVNECLVLPGTVFSETQGMVTEDKPSIPGTQSQGRKYSIPLQRVWQTGRAI